MCATTFLIFVRLALCSNTLEKSTLRAEDDDDGNDKVVFSQPLGWLASPQLTQAIRDGVCFGDGYVF